MKEYYLIVFKNTHDAIQGEKVLKEEGLNVIIMPTPTYITKSCGISVRFNTSDVEKVKEIIGQDKMEIKNIYHKTDEKFELVI
ncbi:DUF3343 domain-containing protein [Clostridium frigidicarnis]|uniref:Putative Se/S carrier protein-like domain-containing protein n=1 Tax=Clostridium frigidicarnis TaxID=84698 RepID=A0A1I1A6W8_9CLOT|nr:DUF3343 domain-containing protein [Clostridium frigidicarnis]SFB32163.1 Protein of unknown function [Clostridium frigidicarnis]